jgi:hypothetical protein
MVYLAAWPVMIKAALTTTIGGNGMHLSEKDAPRYEQLKKLADLLDWAGVNAN